MLERAGAGGERKTRTTSEVLEEVFGVMSNRGEFLNITHATHRSYVVLPCNTRFLHYLTELDLQTFEPGGK